MAQNEQAKNPMHAKVPQEGNPPPPQIVYITPVHHELDQTGAKLMQPEATSGLQSTNTAPALYHSTLECILDIGPQDIHGKCQRGTRSVCMSSNGLRTAAAGAIAREVLKSSDGIYSRNTNSEEKNSVQKKLINILQKKNIQMTAIYLFTVLKTSPHSTEWPFHIIRIKRILCFLWLVLLSAGSHCIQIPFFVGDLLETS